MKALDRLIIKAKKKCGADLKLHSGIIYPSEIEPGKWIARGDLWNGIPYDKPGNRVEYKTYVCNSIEEAEIALQELGEQYPNNKDIAIIIDNVFN